MGSLPNDSQFSLKSIFIWKNIRQLILQILQCYVTLGLELDTHSSWLILKPAI